MRSDKRRKEGAFTRDVCKTLIARGCDISVISGTRFSRNNPDRLVIHRDAVWLLEFKNVGKMPPPAQVGKAREVNAKRPRTSWVVQAYDYSTTAGVVFCAHDNNLRWQFHQKVAPGDFDLFDLLMWLSTEGNGYMPHPDLRGEVLKK